MILKTFNMNVPYNYKKLPKDQQLMYIEKEFERRSLDDYLCSFNIRRVHKSLKYKIGFFNCFLFLDKPLKLIAIENDGTSNL